MKDHEEVGMDNALDSYIRQGIKNWAAQQNPPEIGRARLLLKASASKSSEPEQAQSRGRGAHFDLVYSRYTYPILNIDLLIQNAMWEFDLAFIPLRIGA